MSGLEGSVEALERQLIGLQVQRSSAQIKKVPPPPPPKKNRAQPQVPRSSGVQVSHAPSYSVELSVNNNPEYGNVPPPPPHLVYGNVSLQSLPLPPPPPPATYLTHYDDNSNREDLLPPPSPVSSNYSELARATRPSYPSANSQYPLYQNYADYGSHAASTYESIYEPIEPIPAMLPSSLAQVSNGCNVVRRPLVDEKNVSSLATMSQPMQYRDGAGDRRPLAKEEEVDALTELLVQSIGEGAEPDTYGICVRCRRRVQGDDAGCTAMDQIYHVECFTCACCGANLQGEPFYAVDGQPFCEQDYLRTLECCSVCDKPIRDRILRATGKPYHPACFVCVACGKSLDGVPFTVDAANQIHCIEDFHAKFAPRCSVCALPIMPEFGQEETVRVVALDRSFHVKCYRCEDCGLLLSSEAEGRGCYPLDDHILCKTCNAQRIRNFTTVITTDL